MPFSGLADHVFGVTGLNDWSARDLQAWEYVPLGPFLGKSFATSISPWVTPLAALDAAWVDLPGQDPEPLPYLGPGATRGLDIDVEIELNGEVVSRPPYRTMYWSPAQMLAHMTVNGASLRTGDLFASGTISGPEPDQRGSFLELSWGGKEPFATSDGANHTFLEDGDQVVLRYSAPGTNGGRIALGEVAGRIEPTYLVSAAIGLTAALALTTASAAPERRRPSGRTSSTAAASPTRTADHPGCRDPAAVGRRLPRQDRRRHGTRIQDRGIAASPYGPHGGIGPGGLGN